MMTVQLPGGARVPALGMGTWRYGEDPNRRSDEIRTLQTGLDRGLTLIDTAEMYGDGGAEEVIAEAIAGRRDEAFLVSKFYPHNASRAKVDQACERSLRRLKTDRIDLYLLHWRGSTPFEETIDALLKLQSAGKIGGFGVSNLDLEDMKEWVRVPGGDKVAVNQLLYNLVRRGIEWDLLPWLRERHIPVMAYSPLEQSDLSRSRRLDVFARERAVTASQVALAWLLAQDEMSVIPKTSDPQRLEENLKSVDLVLSQDDLTELDRLFPPPKGPTPLQML